ncbi:hypothetical protein GGI20_005159 [Coemansia sp. BCRC 34301]|nr:hypothetical protein GGI20_005159 [Coemansia sp. BCRC 34301]
MSTQRTSRRVISSDSDSGSTVSGTLEDLTAQLGKVQLDEPATSFDRASERVGVADAVRARSADYAQGKGVSLGVMKHIPSSVVGAVAHDLQLELSQKRSSKPLRQVPGKEKTGMLARPSVMHRLNLPQIKSHHRFSAPKIWAKSTQPTEIAVPTDISRKQQQQHYHQALNKRYHVFSALSVVPNDKAFVRPKLQTSGGARPYPKSSSLNGKGEISEGMLELMSGLESLRIAKGLSFDTPPDMTITLKPHQRSGVAWMLRNERNKDVCGGIIGDDMGLGKTVQALSLMMAHPPKDGGPHSTLIIAPLATIEHWRIEAETRVQPGLLKVLIFHRLKNPPTPDELAQYDLVVTTYATLLTNWVEPSNADFGSMSVSERDQRDQNLVNSEHFGPLFKLEWRRIILDEAHEIKNPKTKKSKACHDLVARYRWCLSGTPIQNSIEDVYSLLRFLRIRPYCIFEEFNDTFVSAINGRQSMRAVLSKLMLRRDKLTVVDSKPILNLPQRYFYYHAIDLNIAERIYYDCIKQQAAKSTKLGAKNNFLVLLTRLLRLRQTTSHLLITSTEPKGESSESESESSEALRFGLLEARMPISLGVDRFWMSTKDVVCNIPIGSAHAGLELPDRCAHCDVPIDHLKGIWVHRCGAFICHGCAKAGVNGMHCRACKLRRPGGYELDVGRLSKKDVESVIPENGCYFARCIYNRVDHVTPSMIEQFRHAYSGKGSSDSPCPSSKMQRILSILRAIQRSNPEDKCVVFCEHLQAISLIAAYIGQHGFSSIIYQGTMSKRQRDEALVSFASNKDVPVLIVSKHAGAVGINLMAANHIILESAWWNPSIDSQAIDRIYRIGQTKSVHVHILVAQKTVDEMMHAIQESKRGLIDSVIGQDTGNNSNRLTTSDVLHMLQAPLSAAAIYARR